MNRTINNSHGIDRSQSCTDAGPGVQRIRLSLKGALRLSLPVPLARLLTALLAVLSLSPVTGKERDDRPGAAERRNQDLIRTSGFQDVELERLHASLATQVQALSALALPDIEGDGVEIKPPSPQGGTQPVSTSQPGNRTVQSSNGETHPSLIPSREHSFVKGKDSEGKTYYRLRLKEGINTTTEPRPDRFIFRAHAYLYLNPAGTALDRVVLQFYRVRFSRHAYVREIRRILHPGPFGAGAPNAGIVVEFRHYPETFPPADLTIDGIPRPILSGEPQLRSVLHSPDDPMAFDKQSRILETYRSLLRKLDRQLSRETELRRLNRNADIERAMDFTGTSF